MTAPPTRPTDPCGPGPPAGEVTVLVVDDAAVDRRVAGRLVEQRLGYHVLYAEDGAAALAAMERRPPHAVVTDLIMPGMDGLQLVEAVRQRHPAVPVILLTAHGSEDVAARALREGAANYVPKRRLDADLVRTVEQAVKAAAAQRQRQRLWGCLTRLESAFVLENDPALISALVAQLRDDLLVVGLFDETEQIRVGISLEEALVNALYHGNLEVSSELREEDDGAYYRLVEERRRQPPYRDRRLHLTAALSPAEAVYTLRDEGPGFDPSGLPDPTDPANLESVSGRGLLLIRTFMDEVTFNQAANQITLVKRRAPPRPPTG
jgi:CheY-like chemotaxis protein/anti-sigma regulatory factor (Ser/Thr protein kinase)